MFNIPKNIIDSAESLGLELIATGGGCDYVFFRHNDEDVILADTEDAGSPDDLDAPACVMVFDAEDWQDLREEIYFENSREALDYMATRKKYPAFFKKIMDWTEARAYIEELVANCWSYHFDDDPDDIIWNGCEDAPNRHIRDAMSKRAGEMVLIDHENDGRHFQILMELDG